MISRGQAQAIAESALLARGMENSIWTIWLEEEVISRAPSIYNGPDLSRCWIGYLENPDPSIYQSSTIVLIDREDGVVRYVGSGNDEG
jgi:hypothetical protein